MVSSQSGERLGYPTQKPVALLERIIKTATDEGDVVLDPFCGCGTALVAAQKLKRKWIGIDISPTACKLMKKRLQKEFKINIQVIRGEVDMNYI
jgi:site-specific DNA-methyltransferase (adenine-specific)